MDDFFAARDKMSAFFSKWVKMRDKLNCSFEIHEKCILYIATILDSDNIVAVQALLLNFSKAFDFMKPDRVVENLLALSIWPSIVSVYLLGL